MSNVHLEEHKTASVQSSHRRIHPSTSLHWGKKNKNRTVQAGHTNLFFHHRGTKTPRTSVEEGEQMARQRNAWTNAMTKTVKNGRKNSLMTSLPSRVFL